MRENEKFAGIAGLGYWGKNVLRVLSESGVLRSACDNDPGIISERKKEFTDVNYVDSFEGLINDPKIKAIAVCTPAGTHYMLVKKALEAGKDVFVEKPLALSVKEGEELAGIARKTKKILMVGHILQYHPAVIKLKGLIASGELGKIYYIYSNRLNIGKLRTEENILWSFAPHDISAMLMLIDEEPASVKVSGGDYLNQGIYDITMTTLAFKNGVKGHIFVSWLHPYKEQKLIVVGSKAMAVFDDMTKEKLFIYPHTIEWKEGKIPVAHKADYKVIPVESKEPLKEELMHFISCVKQRKTPKTDADEGLRVLKILDTIEKALIVENEIMIKGDKARYFVHKSACLDEDVKIGEGTKVWHFSHILKGSAIGKECVIGQNVTIGPDVSIGDRCKIQNNVSVYKGVTLEDEVFCGPSCVFTNVYNPRAFVDRKREFRKTLLKRGATIGANATIVCGVTIGKYSMVGAGAVVKSNVPDHGIVAGVPAKPIGWTCECGTTLKFERGRATCSYCANRYSLKKDKITAINNKDR